MRVALVVRMQQKPYFRFDHETRKQIEETCATLLDHLRDKPDDLQGLVLADVFAELDRSVAVHAARFRQTRTADWKWRAKELGIDRLLFHLARGLADARIGKDAIAILERRAAEIGEARAAGTAVGLIDKSYVPKGVRASFHPSGHLARASVDRGELRQGELVLDATPGSGRFRIIEKRGGYGTMISDEYRDGCVITTLNTPWHDGEESREPKPWTRWVEENLADLARLARRK